MQEITATPYEVLDDLDTQEVHRVTAAFEGRG